MKIIYTLTVLFASIPSLSAMDDAEEAKFEKVMRSANITVNQHYKPKPWDSNHKTFGEKITDTLTESAWKTIDSTPQIALQTVVQLVTQEATVAAIKKLKQLLDPTSADQKKLAFQLKSSEKELQLLTTSIEIISQKIALNNKMLKRYPTNAKIQEIVAKDNKQLENNLVKLLQASTAKLSKYSDTMVEIASYNLEKSAVETAITAVLAEQEPLAEQKKESKDQ